MSNTIPTLKARRKRIKLEELDDLKARALILFIDRTVEITPSELKNRINVTSYRARHLLASLRDDGLLELTGDDSVVRYRRK